MKLGRTSWVILILGVLIIAFGSLGIARAQQVEERKQISEDLTIAEKRLTNLQLRELQSQKLNLEQGLEQEKYLLDNARIALDQTIDSIPVTDELFVIAAATRVKIMELTSTGVKNGDFQDVPVTVIKLNITADGEVLDLINFVTRLNTDIPTGAVQSVDIATEELDVEDVEAGTSGSENVTVEEEEEEAIPRARIAMDIYSYSKDN
ncbi:MAG: hypothetical protein ABID87_06825 [Chloroflexota bacterium]